MKNMSKNVKLLIGAIVILVAIFLLVKKPSKPEPVVTEENKEVVSETKSENQTPSKTTTNTNTNKERLSYSEALLKYKNSRIQFDQACQAIPANQTFKVGTKVMFDNRSPKATTIAIDSNVYLVEAYGYEIVTMNREGSFTANCNNQRNVLTLLIQR
jgi:ABC-type transporter MlaC component